MKLINENYAIFTMDSVVKMASKVNTIPGGTVMFYGDAIDASTGEKVKDIDLLVLQVKDNTLYGFSNGNQYKVDLNAYIHFEAGDYSLPSGDCISLFTKEQWEQEEQYMRPDSLCFLKSFTIKEIYEGII